MERRDTRFVDKPSSEPTTHPAESFLGYSRLGLIRTVARTRPEERFTSLVHLFNVPNLRRAFQELDGTKAPGIDRVTKEQYRKDLEHNLVELERRLRDGSYRPRPSRLVLIPKPQGGSRPLAIGCLEDKIVQTMMARLLEAIFDPLFSKRSYGFRRGKTAHQAIGRLYESIEQWKDTGVVVEMDIEKFFDSMNQPWLMQRIETRIVDPKLLRLLRILLRADVLREGLATPTEIGTPQGSPVSPVLANIYLHFLLDEWFEQNYAPRGRMVRYADDAAFVFKRSEDAEEFRVALIHRLSEGELKLNLDKSAVVPFSRHNPKGTVALLGFELFWGKSIAKKTVLKLKTQPKRLARSMNDFTDWIKTQRNRSKLDRLWKLARSKIEGHFNYYGVRTNLSKVSHFYHHCVGALFKWLNRRSQKRSYTWEQFERRVSANPLSTVRHSSELRDVSSEHNSTKHKPKSRMRENRKSGSVRSVGWQHPAFT
jgi:RNA-directed DNA polymerase